LTAYLDNSATTFLCGSAKKEMINSIENCWGNPSSLHQAGIDADMLLRRARTTLSRALKCDAEEVVFTSGGTEGNNLAIFGAAYANRRKGNKVITTKIEHPSVLNAFKRLGEEGFEVTYIGTDSSGHLDMDSLEAAVDEKTILISVMAVNNEIGTVQPVEMLSGIVKR
jgi:cysteine desulfurase